MTILPRGLYEQLLTQLLQSELASQPDDRKVQLSNLHPAEAPDRIALHLATVIERALSSLHEDDRIEIGVALARELIERIAIAAKGDTQIGRASCRGVECPASRSPRARRRDEAG